MYHREWELRVQLWGSAEMKLGRDVARVQGRAQHVGVELGVEQFATEVVCRHLVSLTFASRSVGPHVELGLLAQTSCQTCLESDQQDPFAFDCLFIHSSIHSFPPGSENE